jgi:hypothetical protein
MYINPNKPMIIAEKGFGHISFSLSAHCYGTAENIFILPVVIPEFKLRDVQREIFLADFMKGSHDSALDEGPKAVNSGSVNVSADIFTGAMVHRLMVVSIIAETIISAPFVRSNKANLSRNNFTNEALQGLHISTINHAGDYFTTALYSADDSSFASGSTATAALVFVLIFQLAADISFIYFYNAGKLAELQISQSSAQAMAHIPGRPIGTRSNHALNLQRGNSLLAGEHQVQDLEPNGKRVIGVLENSPNQQGKAVSLGIALVALPMPLFRFQNVDILVFATGANNLIRPAALHQVVAAIVIGLKKALKFGEGHLPDGFFALFHPFSLVSGLRIKYTAKLFSCQVEHNRHCFC